MKWAKVSKGRVHHVWPKIKKNPDGTTYEVPFLYKERVEAAGKKLPDCFIQVDDHVQEGWVWHEDKQDYGPVIPIVRPQGRTIKDVLSGMIDKRLESFKAEILAAIKDSKDAAP